ncbi:hypothetical protein KGF54_004353 [Candida jiufengensis]|uniref:uncharacterized protein n=1 Tax=Candida jiufengensis TaxID=497108 RepID=UPI002224E850|nr:uncharacterized protein KGF54_004353 [Candida jiufengensis]KAI5951279.1 hypothetical protein KGF54_004353 [Candida jiufengensis]
MLKPSTDIDTTDIDTTHQGRLTILIPILIVAIPLVIVSILLVIVCLTNKTHKKDSPNRVRTTRFISIQRPQAAHLKMEDAETLIDSQSYLPPRNISDLESADTKVN